jgi:small-conductance mechanosensitive channel
MPEGWRALLESYGPVPLIAGAILLGIAAWAAAFGVVRLALGAFDRLARRTTTRLDDDLLARVRGPALLLGPVVGVHVTAAVLGVRVVEGVAGLLETLLLTYVAVATFEILVVETWLEKRQGLKVPGPVRQLVIGVTYGAVLLGLGSDLLGIDLTPLVATGSVTSLVLGLALQQPLSNLFAGIVLHIERHPSVGDWLLVDGREGEVLEIGWRSTRLRTFSDDVLLVPNASLLNAQVVNYAYPTPMCGRQVPVPVPFDVAPEVFDGWVREVLEQQEGVLIPRDPRTKTWLVSIDDHCQRYVVRFWAREFRIHDDLESDLLKGLWHKFAAHGHQFPARFQAVHLVEQPPPAMISAAAPRPTAAPMATFGRGASAEPAGPAVRE